MRRLRHYAAKCWPVLYVRPLSVGHSHSPRHCSYTRPPSPGKSNSSLRRLLNCYSPQGTVGPCAGRVCRKPTHMFSVYTSLCAPMHAEEVGLRGSCSPDAALQAAHVPLMPHGHTCLLACHAPFGGPCMRTLHTLHTLHTLYTLRAAGTRRCSRCCAARWSCLRAR